MNETTIDHLRQQLDRANKELQDEQERHQATLKLLSNADAEFEKVMNERDRLRNELEHIRIGLGWCNDLTKIARA